LNKKGQVVSKPQLSKNADLYNAGYERGVEHERERCAKIAENLYLNDIGKMGSRASIQQFIAAAIRNPKAV
jgi:hypothetical protein